MDLSPRQNLVAKLTSHPKNNRGFDPAVDLTQQVKSLLEPSQQQVYQKILLRRQNGMSVNGFAEDYLVLSKSGESASHQEIEKMIPLIQGLESEICALESNTHTVDSLTFTTEAVKARSKRERQ